MTRPGRPSIAPLSSAALRQLNGLNPLTIHRKSTRAKALFALAVVCILWGTTWLASKEGVRHMPALELAGIRQLIGGSIYLVYFFARGATLPKWKELGPLVVLAFLNFVFSNGLSTWGVKYISAGLASIIGAIFPLWMVVIGFFSGSDRIPPKAILGLVLGFGGVCIIFYEHLEDFFNADFRFGILLSLIATWTWAFGSLYTKKQAARFNPYFGLGFQMVIAGSVLLGISTADPNFLPLTAIPAASWWSIAYLVVFGSLLAFIAYLYSLQHLPTEQASIYAYINPIVAVLLGALLLNEKLTLILMAGGLVTLYGVYLVNIAFKKEAGKFPAETDH
ncbi:MAG TPA: EamA family transporter [Lacibacter sp.]|nr:EamA family transporter [Lacibacter sp.]HMO88108.1 EamA family transporter [Lacibacter sp.]HMP88462.1 EamA family transporter [Lacibacter sp.]